MKKVQLILIIIVILAVLMTACNKATESDPTGNDSSSQAGTLDSADYDAQGEDNISSTDSSPEISGLPGQGDTEDEATQTDNRDMESGPTDNNRPTDDGSTAASDGLQGGTSETPSDSLNKDAKPAADNIQTEDAASDAVRAPADASETAATGRPPENSAAASTGGTTNTRNTNSGGEKRNDSQAAAGANESASDDNSQEAGGGADDTTALNNPDTAIDNAGITQKPNPDFIAISKDNVPEYYFPAEEVKPVEALNPDMSTIWLPVAQDNPISIETSLSQSSLQADTTNVGDYEEEKQDVFRYTYDCVNGCWRFTETAQRGFYFYSMHDMSDPENRSEWPRMRRCYYSDGGFQTQYLETENWFYAPYEDEEGNIYAECGRYISGGMSEAPDIYISKMDQNGKPLSNLRISDLQTEGLIYLGFAYIKKDIIAIIYNQALENAKQGTQLQIIDLKAKKMTAILHLEDEITLKVKSDADYFILTSASYQRVYVFDIDTYELKNTVDTTKCKELCVYEWRVNDFESGRYSSLSYNVDIKDGKLYFLRHSGIYVTDCLKSEFSKLLDGLLFTDFINQQYVYTSFFVGKDEDFYLLGVCVDEESATTMWHYTKNEKLPLDNPNCELQNLEDQIKKINDTINDAKIMFTSSETVSSALDIVIVSLTTANDYKVSETEEASIEEIINNSTIKELINYTEIRIQYN